MSEIVVSDSKPDLLIISTINLRNVDANTLHVSLNKELTALFRICTDTSITDVKSYTSKLFEQVEKCAELLNFINSDPSKLLGEVHPANNSILALKDQVALFQSNFESNTAIDYIEFRKDLLQIATAFRSYITPDFEVTISNPEEQSLVTSIKSFNATVITPLKHTKDLKIIDRSRDQISNVYDQLTIHCDPLNPKPTFLAWLFPIGSFKVWSLQPELIDKPSYSTNKFFFKLLNATSKLLRE
jgi:hypothetical protein